MRTRRRSVALIGCALALGGAACASDDGGEATASTSNTLATPSTTTTIASTTTVATTTTVAATSPTLAPTTTTAAPNITLPPTTTTAPPGAALPMRADGIGDASFGAEPDEVVAYISGVIGNPVEDSGWVAAISLSCPGSEVRFVRWGDLTLWFGDESTVSSGRRHFFAWSFGPAADVQPSPVGLATTEGVGIGSSVVDIGGAYPTASLFEGDETTTASAQLDSDLVAFVTDTRDSGVITAMVGGRTCGRGR